MKTNNETRTKLNIQIPEETLKAICTATSDEGKEIADYMRIAGLIAVCHTRRKAPMTVFIDPRENVTLKRAKSLGMNPVIDLGSKWQGEVRVSIGKNGLFQDHAWGVWVLTPDGLKQVMSFESTEEAKRISVHRSRSLKRRHCVSK